MGGRKKKRRGLREKEKVGDIALRKMMVDGGCYPAHLSSSFSWSLLHLWPHWETNEPRDEYTHLPSNMVDKMVGIYSTLTFQHGW